MGLTTDLDGARHAYGLCFGCAPWAYAGQSNCWAVDQILVIDAALPTPYYVNQAVHGACKAAKRNSGDRRAYFSQSFSHRLVAGFQTRRPVESASRPSQSPRCYPLSE